MWLLIVEDVVAYAVVGDVGAHTVVGDVVNKVHICMYVTASIDFLPYLFLHHNLLKKKL